ncbi:MAG TPA: ABC transporter substrate-binding protein [Acidimicrobiales bacterium]|nr:ABC transporter substrate-binding protein [Acidimicrobiales bacterium]
MNHPIGRRTFLKGMAGAAGAVMLGGACNPGRPPNPEGGPTVRVKSWGDLGYPSPFTYVAGPGYWRMSLLFDTLTWPDSTGQQLPWLASAYRRSEDGLVWSVDLREARWADGRPVTADDVAFTYDYYTSHVFTPLLTGVPRPGVDVRATGERSVEFRLPQPEATFLQQTLGTMPIVPRHIFADITDPMTVFDERTFIGCGAYRLESKNVNADTEAYVAKSDYYLGRPFVRRIEMVGVPEDDELAALRAGVLDGASAPEEGVRNEALAPFRDDPEYGMVSNPSGFGFPLFFNLTKGGALADVRFRRACLHALDRDEMVHRLLTGNGAVGSAGWLPPTNRFYTAEGVRQYPFDRPLAERMLDDAGYRRTGTGGPRVDRDGRPLRFTLNLPDLVPIALAELVVANLGAVGVQIDVRLERVDLVRVYGSKLAANYDMVVQSYPGPAGIGPDGDPDQLRGVYHSDPPSQTHKATGYSNPEVDRLIDAQLRTYDEEERKRLVGRIQQIVSEDLPVAMLYYTTFYYAFRKKVFDQWYYTPGGFASGLSDVYNKHPYITGRKEGLPT